LSSIKKPSANHLALDKEPNLGSAKVLSKIYKEQFGALIKSIRLRKYHFTIILYMIKIKGVVIICVYVIFKLCL
jgi:hypothetical protein